MRNIVIITATVVLTLIGVACAVQYIPDAAEAARVVTRGTVLPYSTKTRIKKCGGKPVISTINGKLVMIDCLP